MALLDFDDLIRSCRSENAREYIKEALDCYRIGAFRSCVIATWIALVYDVIDKLRELALSGDSAAKKRVEEFDEIQKQRDTVAALKFEREIIGLMQFEFELVTAQEASDLGRVLEDRNRCGHPNLNRDTDAYLPPPELARLHLRIVVEHVLQRPPVQGKTAIEQIQKVVDSEYFPTEQRESEKVLEGTPLARIKPKVASDFALGALSSIIRETMSLDKATRRANAYIVARRKHPETIDKTLSAKFDSILTKTDDDFLSQMMWLVGYDPDLQKYVKEGNWARLKSYLGSLEVEEYPNTFGRALDIPALRDAALIRAARLNEKELAAIARRTKSMKIDQAICDRAIGLYAGAGSYDSANSIGRTIIEPLVPLMSLENRRRLLTASANGEVSGSFGFRSVLRAVKGSHTGGKPLLESLFKEAGLSESLATLFEEDTPKKEDGSV